MIYYIVFLVFFRNADLREGKTTLVCPNYEKPMNSSKPLWLYKLALKYDKLIFRKLLKELFLSFGITLSKYIISFEPFHIVRIIDSLQNNTQIDKIAKVQKIKLRLDERIVIISVNQE